MRQEQGNEMDNEKTVDLALETELEDDLNSSFATAFEDLRLAGALREVCALLTRVQVLIERHVPHSIGPCPDHCDLSRQITTALERAKGEDDGS